MEDVTDRVFYLNDQVKNSQMEFLHNRISTGKYSTITFVPKFLFEQFSKYANLFFLFTGTIQLIPGLSPTSPYGTILPLTIVLIITALKELAEDNKRHHQDSVVNNRIVKALHGSRLIDKKWSNVQVGDILRIENNEYFPADMILLSSSEPDALCFIETSNLDGETNLKIKQGLTETSHLIGIELLQKLRGVVRSELPNNRLYTFEGTMTINNSVYPLSPTQLLLRGAQLRNTRWIYSVVVFTGHETKLLQNATETPIKRTKVERTVNRQILFLFLLLITISLSCSIGYLVRQLNGSFERYILFESYNLNDALSVFCQNILTYIILFNNLIPLSLMVTMEFVKYMLGVLINSDLDMYDIKSDTPATAKTSSLVEELGQVDFIFSDKTGTLTRNIMEFKMASIGGIGYAETVTDDQRFHINENGKEMGYHELSAIFDHRTSNHPNSKIIDEFLTLLSVCHTVIPERDEDDPTKLTYQASSPDEAALVNGAKSLGYMFHTRQPKSIQITKNGVNKEYQVLNICEFNSTRKRMSCIVKTPENKIMLYTKGADTVILERLSAFDNPFIDNTSMHLEEYASEGLRTLCLAFRELSNEEYTAWSKIYEKASAVIRDRQEALDNAAELIEKDLFLLGATAIEDKLQEGVPETIHTLMDAGIRIWVLTGDRQETAINIGFSCKLLSPEMNLMICNETNLAETKLNLERKLLNIKSAQGMGKPIKKHSKWVDWFLDSPIGISKKIDYDLEPMALIIDGKSLEYALHPTVKYTFLNLALICRAVICCRVSPLQKALVVSHVKDNVADSITLAIGDGANDVGMIQAAHVGVGISGQEGLQAARNADFAIAQFRFLEKLLLVHGGWAYARICRLILYSFYKNITLYLIQLWFAIDNGFSAQTLFETWSAVSSYNVLWSVLPPVVIGLFDQYVSARMLVRYPKLYKIGQKGYFYNHGTFGNYVVNSFLHSFIIYMVSRAILDQSVILSNGHAADNWLFGVIVYSSELLTVLVKATLVLSTWVNYFTYLAIFGSMSAFLSGFYLYAQIAPLLKISMELRGLASVLYSSGVFWATLLLIPVFANLRDFTWRYMQRTYLPESYHITQEIQGFNIPDYRPRMEWFRKAIHKVRLVQRRKRSLGYAFSQNESGQLGIIRSYDTTKRKPTGF